MAFMADKAVWSLHDGVCASLGIEPFDPRNERRLPSKIGEQYGRRKYLAELAIVAEELRSIPSVNFVRLRPLDFVEWVEGLRSIDTGPEWKELARRVKAAALANMATKVRIDGKQTEPSPKFYTLRPSQRHKERCRAVAELVWKDDPTITIADMILRDEITVQGCERKNYSETTLRKWINDLAPNRLPGRRPKQ